MTFETGGQGLEPRFPGPKPGVLASWTTPQLAMSADTTMQTVSAPTVVIIAAGEGTRMRSALPKVLHPLCGRPLILWPVIAAEEAGAGKVVVVDNPKRRLEDRLPESVKHAIQPEPNGTGGAVIAAVEHIEDDETVVILAGDVPLITAEAITRLVEQHDSNDAAATMATMELDDPGQYGRVIRDETGNVTAVVEAKGGEGDATPEQLEIREVNTGIYAFGGKALKDALDRLTPDNAQGELYLPDVLPQLTQAGETVQAHLITDPTLTLGVNDRVQLAEVRKLAQRRIHDTLQREGVSIIDPDSTHIDADVRIGQDTIVEPGTSLKGNTRIGRDCLVDDPINDLDRGSERLLVHRDRLREPVGIPDVARGLGRDPGDRVARLALGLEVIGQADDVVSGRAPAVDENDERLGLVQRRLGHKDLGDLVAHLLRRLGEPLGEALEPAAFGF